MFVFTSEPSKQFINNSANFSTLNIDYDNSTNDENNAQSVSCEQLLGLPKSYIENIFLDSISFISGGCFITTLIYGCFCS